MTNDTITFKSVIRNMCDHSFNDGSMLILEYFIIVFHFINRFRFYTYKLLGGFVFYTTAKNYLDHSKLCDAQ